MHCVILHQALSATLSAEQKYIVDRMVEAHGLYRAQDSSHCRVGHTEETSLTSSLIILCCPDGFLSVSAQLLDWPCTEEGEGLSDVLSPHLQRLLQFARTVPGKMDRFL